MKNRKSIYILMFLPLVLTVISWIFLPDQVAIRYSSKGIQYGSKFSLIILPVLSLWIGMFLVLIAKIVSNTPQEKTVRKITYVPLIIFNLVTAGALIGAFFVREEKANMEILDIVIGSMIGFVAISLAVYAFFTAHGKGPIISNPYIWMSKEEREKVDKKAEYRQLTIVFACLAFIFAMLAIYVIASWKWAYVMMWILIVFVILYAIVSSIRSEIKK